MNGALTQPSQRTSPPTSEDVDIASTSSSPCSIPTDLSDSFEFEDPVWPPPPLSLAAAKEDAARNILYVMEKYPTENLIYMAEHFRNAPVDVEGGDRVLLLEELPNFTMKIRVISTGQEGLLPAWNIEDPYDRLARLNMEFNDAITCPAEIKARGGIIGDPNSPLLHEHSECPAHVAAFTDQARKVFKKRRVLEANNTFAHNPAPEIAHEAVKFTDPYGKVFRYISPPPPPKVHSEPDPESESSEGSSSEADEFQWSDGWVEDSDSTDEDEDAEDVTSLDVGRSSPSPTPAPISTPPTPRPGFPITISILPAPQREAPRQEPPRSEDNDRGHFRGRHRFRRLRRMFK